MKQVFEILKTGNFYFPLKDIGKKFKILDTYTLTVDDKESLCLFELYCKFMKQSKYSSMDMPILAGIFWKAVRKVKLHKKFKNCWFVPNRVSKFDKFLEVHIDILKPIRRKK